MANHVSTYIQVQSDEPKVYQKLIELFDGKSYEELSDTMTLYNILYPENEGYDRGEYSELMGSKWVYTDNIEMGDDYFEMATVSAWYYCEGVIERLGSLLSQIDKEVLVSFTFEDESLDPIGGGAWYQNDLVMFEESYEWPDEEELSPEEYDEAYDGMWEDVHDITESLKQTAISKVMNN